MIDTQESLNIKDLLIPEAKNSQEGQFRFDPENEMNASSWQVLKSELLADEVGGNWDLYADTAGPAAILFPNKREEVGLDTEVKDRIKDAIRSEMSISSNLFMDSTHRPRAAMLQALFPESNIAEELRWGQFPAVAIIKDGLDRDFPLLYDRMVFDSLLLYPGIAQELVSHPRLKATLERESMNDLNAFNPYNAAALKLLYPDTADKQIINSKINELSTRYDGLKGKSKWRETLGVMLPLAILTAGKAEIVPHGIELSLGKKAAGFVQTQKAMPEVRRF